MNQEQLSLSEIADQCGLPIRIKMVEGWTDGNKNVDPSHEIVTLVRKENDLWVVRTDDGEEFRTPLDIKIFKVIK